MQAKSLPEAIYSSTFESRTLSFYLPAILALTCPDYLTSAY
jgi:hypothetical protein